MFHRQTIFKALSKDLHNSLQEKSCAENDDDTTMQDDDEENDPGKDKDELGAISIFEAFCLTSSKNIKKWIDYGTTEMKDDINTSTVHLIDIEFSSSFK